MVVGNHYSWFGDVILGVIFTAVILTFNIFQYKNNKITYCKCVYLDCVIYVNSNFKVCSLPTHNIIL